MKPMTAKLDLGLQAILARKNVVSIGKGFKRKRGKKTKQISWIITVEQKLPLVELTAADIIPAEYKGLPTDVIVGKMPQPRFAPKPRTDRWRPAPGGVSIGHYEITAGTFGVLVYKGGRPYILSNNHVLANLNEAEIGDPILQPGAADGGALDVANIATLFEFVPIEFSTAICPFARAFTAICNFFLWGLSKNTRLKAIRQAEANLVDCALAKPDLMLDVLDEVLDIGSIEGEQEPLLGLPVQKSGRTTALTQGIIEQVEATVKVNMGELGIADFTDVFIMNDISDPGDSGSLIVSKHNQAVGLLFAGSNTQTIACKYSNVKKAFGLDSLD
ncbi:hypothetical protein ES708_10552 [subsurface metagenome]